MKGNKRIFKRLKDTFFMFYKAHLEKWNNSNNNTNVEKIFLEFERYLKRPAATAKERPARNLLDKLAPKNIDWNFLCLFSFIFFPTWGLALCCGGRWKGVLGHVT